MHALTQFFLNLLQSAGWEGLFAAMTLANIGAPIGSEVILPAAGAASAQGILPALPFVVLVAVAAELFGQSIAYAVGYYGGRPFVDRFGRYVRFHHDQLERVEAFFRKYGSFAIFVCRFTPVIRGIVGVPAGIAKMPLPAFYLWTLLGSAGFCGALVLLGHALGVHAHEVIATVRRFGYLIIALAVVAAALFVALQAPRYRKPS